MVHFQRNYFSKVLEGVQYFPGWTGGSNFFPGGGGGLDCLLTIDCGSSEGVGSGLLDYLKFKRFLRMFCSLITDTPYSSSPYIIQVTNV